MIRMSDDHGPARPSQVTVAGWTAMAAGVVVVLVVFETMSRLHGVDMRDELTKVVAGREAKRLGLTVDDAIAAVHWMLLASGVAAAAAAILGFFVLRRDRGARIGLTVAAVPIVLTAPLSGLPGLLVGVAAAMLWSRPARDWFAGRAPVQRQMPAPAPAPRLNFPPPTQQAIQAPVVVPPTPIGSIPARVRLACLITGVFGGLTGVAALVAIPMIAAKSDALVRYYEKSPLWSPGMRSTLVPTMITLVALTALWCAAVVVLAFFAWRGRQWAWMLLVASTALAALLSLVAFPYTAAHLAATALCLGLLLNRQSRDWFTRRAGWPPPAG